MNTTLFVNFLCKYFNVNLEISLKKLLSAIFLVMNYTGLPQSQKKRKKRQKSGKTRKKWGFSRKRQGNLI